MKCPKCGSTNTHKPSVRSARWKVGTQICGDCDHQSDWIDFCDSLPIEERERIKAAAAPILAPLHKMFDPEDKE